LKLLAAMLCLATREPKEVNMTLGLINDKLGQKPA
jgi:hypothetical protein